MRLIDVNTYELKEFWGSDIPPYAILSHTWADDEVSCSDMQERLGAAKQKASFNKIRGCCIEAVKHGLKWAWVDSCCIDKRSSAELSEAINSMFAWYTKSDICFVYLADVLPGGLSTEDANNLDDEFSKSRWFTRGWTLQELIAPQ